MRMRRTLHYIFVGFIALSSILCLASVALWVRSYWWCDVIGYGTDPRYFAAASARGGFFVGRIVWRQPTEPSREFTSERLPLTGESERFNAIAFLFIGFGDGHEWTCTWHQFNAWKGTFGARRDGHQYLAAVFPQYYLTFLLGIPPMAWLSLQVFRWMRGPRVHRPGFCAKCGYDLRATPERCPECGTAVSEKGYAASTRRLPSG